jgi:hypothetical protein
MQQCVTLLERQALGFCQQGRTHWSEGGVVSAVRESRLPAVVC